jgi:uncharacterized iron-regulated membrane protein
MVEAERQSAHQVARLRKGFWRHPRPVWVRRAMFQIHLWVGILLCLYALIIGVSGSILVFEEELARLSYPKFMQPSSEVTEPVTAPRLDRISRAVERAYPEWRLGSIYSPGVHGSNYVAIISRGTKYSYVFASSADERLLGMQPLDKGWLNWVADLHFRLLGGTTGLVINGIGAACLLLLCLSGIVIWWPGVKTWKHALVIDFRRRWKRINFDLHSAIGFWTLGIMSLWAISGIYFVWPEAFVSAVHVVSESPNAAPPKFHLTDQRHGTTLPLETLITKATAVEPGAKIQGINYASGDQPFSVMLTRDDDASAFLHTTFVYLDSARGSVLGVWRIGRNETLGDRFVWLLAPLHFGTYWGFGVKILWALLGITLPVLAITGVLMYWNRYLSKKWRALKTRPTRASPDASPANVESAYR